MFLSMIKKSVVVKIAEPADQSEVQRLRDEVVKLKNENEALKLDNDVLRRRANLDSDSWADLALTDVINKMDAQFQRIGKYLTDALAPNYAVLRIESKDIKFEGDLMARVEALMRYKEKVDANKFKNAVRLLIGGYFSDATIQGELEQFVFNCDRDVIASAIASRLSYKNADKGVEAIVYAYCKAAVMQTNIVIGNAEEVVDATRIKYNYRVEDQVDIRPIVSHDANHPASGQLDHIYNKHYIDGRTAALVHALSHVDASINGSGLALYHVGTATRFAECSMIYIDGTPYKPFRVMKEYALFPVLPNEYQGRVEAVMTIFGGLSPISLVRVYDTLYMPSGLITGSISHAVCSLLANTVLYSCLIGFSPYGMFIQAIGNTDMNSRSNINCCQASFGLSPGMHGWNIDRYKGKLCNDNRVRRNRRNFRHFTNTPSNDQDNGNNGNQEHRN
ncbi:VP5 [Mangshi virus]|nr:VP5 [Mangshi virus]